MWLISQFKSNSQRETYLCAGSGEKYSSKHKLARVFASAAEAHAFANKHRLTENQRVVWRGPKRNFLQEHAFRRMDNHANL